jgi:hypothetical protein
MIFKYVSVNVGRRLARAGRDGWYGMGRWHGAGGWHGPGR